MGKESSVDSRMFTLDTNILVYYAAGDSKVVSFLLDRLKKGEIFYVPTIVVVEFFSFPALTPKDSELFEYLLLRLDITTLDVRIAKIAGDLRKRYGLKLGDSVVAASALATSSTLLTRNIRDFKKIPELEIRSL